MVFIETSYFTARLHQWLDDSAYAAMQSYLSANPEAGVLIQATGGLRKLRWAASGKGKRGGVRVIYYYLTADDQIRMLLLYAKSHQSDLSTEQLATLRKINEEWK